MVPVEDGDACEEGEEGGEGEEHGGWVVVGARVEMFCAV